MTQMDDVEFGDSAGWFCVHNNDVIYFMDLQTERRVISDFLENTMYYVNIEHSAP